MSDSLRLSVPDLTDATAAAAFFRVADAAHDVDGYDPFNEQARLDLASGHRTPILVAVSSTDALWQADAVETAPTNGRVVGAAVVGAGELDLVIDPVFRGKGYGGVAVIGLLPHAHGTVTAWSHGDHPAARVLAPRFGFEPVRTLLQLRLAPARWSLENRASDSATPAPSEPASEGKLKRRSQHATRAADEPSSEGALRDAPRPPSKTTEISSGSGAESRIAPPSSKSPSFSTGMPGDSDGAIGLFRLGVDEDEWVALNARVFASHPEQGRITVDDLRAREAEPWFDAGDFLVARDASGRLVGYNWLKVEPEAAEGEIYVIGVDAASAGHGLGRRLMEAGLARLAERGCTSATLYVEADNLPAVRLYRSLGFADHTVDVQYRRVL